MLISVLQTTNCPPETTVSVGRAYSFMKYHKKILKNGLRVIAIPLKDSTTVTVLVMVEAGSKYETKEINGLSHFLEHMCFKGTLNRPRSIDITHELDSIGAEYNAFTGQEYTGYYAKAHPKHFTKILDVVSDVYLNPLLEEKEIEKEKGVVIEEINMYEDNHPRKVRQHFEALLYGDQPAGWTITGSKENVQLLKRDQISEYRHKHYVSQATAVIISGSVDVSAAFKAVAKKFAGMETKSKGEKRKVKEIQKEPALVLTEKETEQTHILIGVRAYDVNDPRCYALLVLDAVLGGGMSSRLWQKIREEMGVAYYTYSFADFLTDHGYFAVGVGADNNRVLEVVETIIKELKRFKTEKISDAELQKAKDYTIGKMYLNLESSDEIAEFYGEQEIIEHELKKPAEVARRIKEVTAEDIQKVAKDILKTSKLNLALIGRFKDVKALKKLLIL